MVQTTTLLNWFRSFSDPLTSANNAARWIGQLPTDETANVQKEALELVSSFPGPRKEAGPGQVEALLRIDARVERAPLGCEPLAELEPVKHKQLWLPSRVRHWPTGVPHPQAYLAPA